MRIAVISNGPSARLFDRAERDGYDTLIAVNEAATVWRCKWWSAIDWKMFALRSRAARGEPRLFTRCSTPGVLREHCDDERVLRRMDDWLWAGRVLIHEHMPRPWLPEECPPWNSYSGTAALILAWHLRADAIDVYGADMAGDGDCVGGSNLTRRASRWAHERRIFDGIATFLGAEGVRLRRITDDCREVKSQG